MTARFVAAYAVIYLAIRLITELALPNPEAVPTPIKALIAFGIAITTAIWLSTGEHRT
jgi:hypothetical protein